MIEQSQHLNDIGVIIFYVVMIVFNVIKVLKDEKSEVKKVSDKNKMNYMRAYIEVLSILEQLEKDKIYSVFSSLSNSESPDNDILDKCFWMEVTIRCEYPSQREKVLKALHELSVSGIEIGYGSDEVNVYLSLDHTFYVRGVV